jgi:4-hydroxy-tetrahydrodipicolinate reductase
MATRIVVCGARGRMGRTIAQLAKASQDFEIIGGIDRATEDDSVSDDYPSIVLPENAAKLIGSADVIIDFSAPAALHSLLDQNADAFKGKALVVGTTGLTADDDVRLNEAARESAVLVAANFSIGVNLLLALAEQAAKTLGPQDYDVEIIEAHHRNKVDAPSGTALALGRAVAAGREIELQSVRRDSRSGNTGKRPDAEIGFHAIRGGDIVGEHSVLFIGRRERIELSHIAGERSLFADGALRAALWISGKTPGRYTMRQVLGL